MIICPNCQHEEVSGAIFCSECGTLLDGLPGVTTQTMPKVSFDQRQVAQDVAVQNPFTPYLESEISLCIVDTSQIIPLEEREEFTLGRSAEGQPILPDVDLSPFRAYENGVSRLHASIKKQDNLIVITDLGSQNGTRLNGQKIAPHKPFSLNHGDILTLGKLKLQILFRKTS